MYTNIVLSLPLVAIGFVVILYIYNIFIKIRYRFDIAVNCWFCNHNTKVPYLDANSWMYPSCEQYNGEFNPEIYEQLDSSAASENRFNVFGSEAAGSINNRPLTNELCDLCNEAQRVKVDKLAKFKRIRESRYDEELKVYHAQLEEQYRLCSTCNRHLNKLLPEKKTKILVSKFLDANSLTYPSSDQYNTFTKDGEYNQNREKKTILRSKFLDDNSLTYPSSDQYNCFKKDAELKREIYQKFNVSASQAAGVYNNRSLANGFCNLCNEAQLMKIEKLAQFEPINESRFYDELKHYQALLEKQYRLCYTCNCHLYNVLRRQNKKMIKGCYFEDCN